MLMLPPVVVGIRLQARAKVEGPRVTPELRSGVLMDFEGGHREDRVVETHGVDIQVAKEVPEQWMRDKAILGHREMDGQPPGFESAIQIGCALDLEDEPGRELAANMRLQVAPLVVRYGRQDLKGSFAPQHEELHELSLGDKSLLGRGYRRHAASMTNRPKPPVVDRRASGTRPTATLIVADAEPRYWPVR